MDKFAVIIIATAREPLTDRQGAAIGIEAGGTLAYERATGTMRLSAAAGDGLDAQQALTQVTERFLAAVRHHAGMQAGIRELRALPWEEFEAETFRPGTPRGGLAGTAEVAEILQVAPQRVAQLLKDRADFPRPVTVLAATPVWDRAEIDAFGQAWERRPGRPRKTAGGNG